MLCSFPVNHHSSRGPTTHFTYIIPHSSCILHSSASNFKTRLPTFQELVGLHLSICAFLQNCSCQLGVHASELGIKIVIVHEAIAKFSAAPTMCAGTWLCIPHHFSVYAGQA